MMSLTVYKASAGSGKTYTLTHAFVHQLLKQEHPTGYLHQMALTFTRKATEEMKQRILSLLNELSLPPDSEQGVRKRESFCREEGCEAIGADVLRRRAVALRSAILHDYGRFSVYTIDTFFQRIVRSFIWEAGLPSAYSVEFDKERLLQEAIDQVVDEVATHPQNRKWIADMLMEQIQQGRRWNVHQAFAQVGNQLFNEQFLALGQEFIYNLSNKDFLNAFILDVRAQEAVFRQQMEQYAQKVLAFLDGEGLSTTDFKGKKNSFMRYFDKVTKGTYKPTDSVRRALDDISLWSAKNDPKAPKIESIYPPLHRLMQDCIDYYDAHAPLWFSHHLILGLLPQMGLSADLWRHIHNILRDNNSIYLTDTLLLLCTLISQNDAPFILERMGCRYTHFLLDEFQDTSVLQWKVLLPLIHNGLAQGGFSLVVGDVKQSIYRWRNSDWRILGGGVHRDLQVFCPVDKSLDINWRSREVLVNTVGAVFERLVESVYQDFLTILPQTVLPQDEERIAAIPEEILKVYTDVHQLVAPDLKESGGYVSISNVIPTEELSAKEQVLERLPFLIMELQGRGFSASDIAVLVRKNDEGQQIASTLTAFKERPEAKGFCFEVVSPDALFLARAPEVQLVMAIFKSFVNPRDTLNNHLIERLSTQLNTVCPESLWSGSIQHQALPQAFEEIIRILQWTERQASFPYIQELHSQVMNFSNPSGARAGYKSADVFSFVQWWNQNGHKVPLPLERSGSAIEILTIHKAKGLEYPVVIIPFCDWGLDYLPAQAPLLWVESKDKTLSSLPFVPQRYGNEMAQSLYSYDYLYEKMQYRVDVLNIFYVAATRAKDELHLFLPQPKRTSCSIASILQQVIFSTDVRADLRVCPSSCPADAPPPPPPLTFGTPLTFTAATPPITEPPPTLTRYPSHPSSLRLHMQLADESPAVEGLSPRKRGIVLHRLLSRISTFEDIDMAIRELVVEGLVGTDPQEQASYKQALCSALSQPLAASWFDGSWTLHNETSILLPAANGQTLRPDRVMEKEGRTLVIDYKFGAPHPAHRRQMDGYIEVLKQMGHKEVEGHVWYL